MRRHTFVGLVFLCLALVLVLPNQAPANVYATNLQASAPAFAPGSGQSITFSFILNEDADTGVTVKVFRASNDQLVRQVDLGPLTKGTQSWVWDGKDNGGAAVSLGEAYYFTVSASSAGHTDWTMISDDFNPENKFEFPNGVDVNKDPNSKYYGRVYVSVGRVGTTTAGASGPARSVSDGIYALNPDSSDAVGQGDVGLTAGVDWTTGGTSSPWKIMVGPDDQIYVADWSDAHGGVWVGDPNFSSAYSILDPTGADASGLTTNHGSVPACFVDGIGVSRVLYTMDEDYPASGAAAIGSVWRYDIGCAPMPWLGKPTAVYNDDWPNAYILNYTNDMTRDSAGNAYMLQIRYDGVADGLQSLMKVDASGNVLFRSYPVWGNQDPVRDATAVAIDEAHHRLAVGCGSVQNGITARINILDPDTLNIRSMDCVDAWYTVAVGDSGRIVTYQRNEDQTKAVQTYAPVSAKLNAVAMADNFNGVAVGDAGTVVQFVADWPTGTLTTTTQPSPTTANLNSVFTYMSGTAQRVLAVGDAGNIWRSADGGATWAQQDSGTTADLKSVCTVPTFVNQIAYACGTNGTLIRSTNYGIAPWEALSSGTTANLNSVSMAARGWVDLSTSPPTIPFQGWAVGDNGTILRTEDGGNSWTTQSAGTTENFTSVVASTTLLGEAVTSAGSVYRTDDGGATWTKVGTQSANGIAFLDPSIGYAASSAGSLMQTKDGGASWAPIATGVTENLNAVYTRTWTGNYIRDVAFDAVGNLYAVDYMSETLRIYSPPDGANSSTTKSYGVVVASSGDTTPPSTPVVTDDGAISYDNTQVHATWSGASDPESGVVEYQYAVTTLPMDLGKGYLVNWTSAGTSTSATATGLDLPAGKYYMLVKAKNGAGIWSDVGVSDGITVFAGSKIGEAKEKDAGSVVALQNAVVTATLSDYSYDQTVANTFFVEEQDRSAGIAVLLPSDGSLAVPGVGSVVDVLGSTQVGVRGDIAQYPTDNNAYMAATDMSISGTGTVAPVYSSGRSLGGDAFGIQPGATGGSGLNTTGLLVRTFGSVTYSSYGIYGSPVFYLDDGSGVTSDIPGVIGVKCYVPLSLGIAPNPGQYVSVTGVSDLELLDPTPGSPGDEQMIKVIWVTQMN